MRQNVCERAGGRRAAAGGKRQRQPHLHIAQQPKQAGVRHLVAPPDFAQQGLAQEGVQGAERRRFTFIEGAQVGAQEHAECHIVGPQCLHFIPPSRGPTAAKSSGHGCRSPWRGLGCLQSGARQCGCDINRLQSSLIAPFKQMGSKCHV